RPRLDGRLPQRVSAGTWLAGFEDGQVAGREAVVLYLLVHHDAEAVDDGQLLVGVAGSGLAVAALSQAVVVQAGHDAPHHGHPAGAGGQDLGVCGLRGQVDAQSSGVRLGIPGLRQAKRVIGPFLVQHGPAGPGVGDEDQMAQGLGERPLLVDLLGQRCRGQPPGALAGLRPEPLDGVPYRADVVGVTARAELHPLRVAAVQFGADEFGDVDAVDRDVAEVAGDADVDQPAVPDRDAGQVAVGEPRPAQVRDVEPGAAEPRAATALTGVEPVRPELRLTIMISGIRCRADRVVSPCHDLHGSAAHRRRAASVLLTFLAVAFTSSHTLAAGPRVT